MAIRRRSSGSSRLRCHSWPSWSTASGSRSCTTTLTRHFDSESFLSFICVVLCRVGVDVDFSKIVDSCISTK